MDLISLVAVGSALFGALLAGICWVVAAIAYDGAILFGCSDGTKSPDPAYGTACVIAGFGTLIVGFGIAYAIFKMLRASASA